MFKPGLRYVITTLEAEVGTEVQTWAVCAVEKVDGPLIRGRLADGRVIVLNTLSPKFVRAELISND